jgi:hypothetical protein
MQYLNELFFNRMELQTDPLHVLAYYILPANQKVSLNPAHQAQILQLLLDRLGLEGGRIATEQFFDFRRQTGRFHSTMQCWMFGENAKLFWSIQQAEAPELARLAYRILTTPANSVACERAFSAMKFTHNTLRNSMTPERVNKIQFIQMNTHTFDSTGKFEALGPEVSDTDMTEEKLLELEGQDMEAQAYEADGETESAW